MKKSYIAIGAVVVAIFLFFSAGPFYIVNEGSQAVTTRMGRIVNTHTQAGLYMKVPFVDKITTYPARILSLEGDSERIP
ncbi:MAG: protease modulator HflC, partial [Treponema sp.]|nr:protease modulator HflC [Treponema sp.]